MTALSFPWPLSATPDSLFDDAHDSTDSEDEDPPSPHSARRETPIHQQLRHYDASALPPSARVDPHLKQREGQPFSLWNFWRFGAAAATKAAEVATDIVQHQIWGPRRKTWPLGMTIISSFMRNAGRHSHLVDIATMRMLIGIGGLVPLPSDALVTPVTFRVRRRNLRGILADFDAAETGTRELQGEWVVGKRLWKRLQAEWKASRNAQKLEAAANIDVPMTSTFKSPAPKTKGRVVLFFHGGAYYCFSAATHRLLTIPLSKYTDARVFAVDYRLAPETRFPGPLHDAVSAYLRLVEDLSIPVENITVAGDSAGGGLTLALLMYLRDNNYPMPAAAILMSPWVDLTMSCDSWDTNAPYDVVPAPTPGDHLDPIACYLGEHMEKYITHPYASPLFGDLTGLPPLLIQAGEAEVLRDEITLLAHKATMAGVVVKHELYEDAVHVFQAFPFLEASTRAFQSCREFVRSLLIASDKKGRSRGRADSVALTRELDNDRTRVVRGDGTETTASARDVSREIAEEQEARRRSGIPAQAATDLYSSASDEEVEDPSWVASQSPWPSPPPSDDEDQPLEHSRHRSRTSVNASHAEAHNRLATVPSKGKRAERPSLARIQASLTSFMLNNYPSEPPAVDASGPPRARNHRRTPSSQSVHRSRTSTLSVTGEAGVPPKPLIRSSASHADIGSLCAQWASSGPANVTTTYKHDGRPKASAKHLYVS